jgi:hypothetical protein
MTSNRCFRSGRRPPLVISLSICNKEGCAGRPTGTSAGPQIAADFAAMPKWAALDHSVKSLRSSPLRRHAQSRSGGPKAARRVSVGGGASHRTIERLFASQTGCRSADGACGTE